MSQTSSPKAPSLPRIAWVTPATVALLLLLAALFWWTFAWMVLRWEGEGSYYSHGWLIVPVSLYLAWRQRGKLATLPRRATAWGLLLLLPALILQLGATALQIGFLSGFAFVGVIAGLVWTFLGKPWFRTLAVPILFLAFMVPVPDQLIKEASFEMKMFSAGVAGRVTDYMGLDALPEVEDGRRTNAFILSDGSKLVVDDVCSGLKYLISLMAFAALYAHISSVKRWQKAVLFLVSIPVAVLANVGRVVIMVIVGSTQGAAAVKAWYFHDLFGFVFFGVAFICLFLLESLMLLSFRRRATAPPPAKSQASLSVAPDAVTPAPLRPRLFYGVIATMIAVAVLANLARPRGVTPPSGILDAIPLAIGSWQGRDYPVDKHAQEVLGTSNVLARAYRSGTGNYVNLLIVLAQQTTKRTHSPKQCLIGDGNVLLMASDRTVPLTLPTGESSMKVSEMVLQQGDHRAISWHFYKSGHRLSTSYWFHHLALTVDKLHDPSASDILVRVDVSNLTPEQIETGRALLADFFAQAMPRVISMLP